MLFRLGGALKNALIGVVAYPPIARCWDLEDHQLGGVSGDTGQGLLKRNRAVAFVGIGLQCSGHMVLTIFAVGVRQSLLGSDWEDG